MFRDMCGNTIREHNTNCWLLIKLIFKTVFSRCQGVNLRQT